MPTSRYMSGRCQISVLIVCTASLFLTGARAHIVAFGDSYTDAGAGSRQFSKFLNTTKVYPPPPYFNGLFSNGPPYIARAAQLLAEPLQDYAVGGATSGAVEGFLALQAYVPEPIPVPSLIEQVRSYLDSDEADQPVSSETLYLVWAGSNDYLDTYAFSDSLPPAASELVEAVISNITTAISLLADRGANRFVLVNLPPLQLLPAVSQAATGSRAGEIQAALAQVVAEHNARLVGLASELVLQRHRTVVFGAHGVFQSIAASGTSLYNINQTMQPCYDINTGALCANPDEYLFFDILHPTEKVHRILGELLAGEIAV